MCTIFFFSPSSFPPLISFPPLSLWFSHLCCSIWFYSIVFRPAIVPSASLPHSALPHAAFAVSPFCASIFSELFHVKTGNNQAFTGSTHVRTGSASSIHLSKVIFTVLEIKMCPCTRCDRLGTWKRSVTNGDRLIQSGSRLCHLKLCVRWSKQACARGLFCREHVYCTALLEENNSLKTVYFG